MSASAFDQAGYRRGIQLFNEAHFFEAHEALEDVWRASSGPEKKFLQGLVQLAVAFHHHSQNNLVGARSLLERATRNLSGYPEEFCGLRLGSLFLALGQWRVALQEGKQGALLPRLELTEC